MTIEKNTSVECMCGICKLHHRQWQGLTQYEIWQCNTAPPGGLVGYHISMAQQNVVDFAKAIEAKLKEKNT